MLIVMRTAFIKLLEFSTLVQEYFLYIILVLGHNDISFSFWGIKLRALSMKSRYYTVELSLTLLEFFNENCFYRLQIRTLFMVKHSGNLEKKNASICLTRNNWLLVLICEIFCCVVCVTVYRWNTGVSSVFVFTL